jgi:hypothetical protein
MGDEELREKQNAQDTHSGHESDYRLAPHDRGSYRYCYYTTIHQEFHERTSTRQWTGKGSNEAEE